MRKSSISLANKGSDTWRIYFLIVAVSALFFIITFRLFQIQIFKYGFYKALAQDQHEFFEKMIPKRGNIFIKDKYSDRLYPLVVNKEVNLIYAVPDNIKDKEKTAKELSGILDIKESEILDIIDKKNDPYEVIMRKASDEMAGKIKNAKMAGIGIAPENIRYYPENELAANVVGFVGYKDNKKVGQYGIEGYYNDKLEGKSGFLEQEKDALGNWISIGSKSVEPSQNGDDIVLTLDQTIQYIAEKKLKEAVEKNGADSGDLIVMDPKSGAIIAMAQYPTFNPNEYFKEKDMSVFLNSNIHSVYEPGSIGKPITIAIGLDLNKINPDTTYIDEGVVKIGGWSIRNYDGKANGAQTMTQILEKSLNTGAIYVQRQIDKEDFYKYLKKFGLDELKEVEISGEIEGNLSNLKDGNDINYATASYGQGISVTPLGMLTALSVFANDGKLMKPYIVDELIHADGTSEKTKPAIVRQVVSSRTANLVTAMMVSVVENGHSKGARIHGYKFAGKTGTAQVAKKESKGYEEGKTIHTFVGFGPLPDPKFSILVKLENPKSAIYAESTATPVFHDMTEELISYHDIPPAE